jgi:hypothetical protein
MMEAWVAGMRREGRFLLTDHPSPIAKRYDYNNLYVSLDSILRDIRILLAAYF